jgi:hypothetical protein
VLASTLGLLFCALSPSASRASLIWESNVGSALPLSGFLANGVSGAPTPANGLQIVPLDAQHDFTFEGGTVTSLMVATSGFVWLQFSNNPPQSNTAQCCVLGNMIDAKNFFEQGVARILPGWAALRPDLGGSIDFNQISDANGNRTVVTYQNVATDATHTVSFQVQLFTSGQIIFSYLHFDATSLGPNLATVIGLTSGGDFSPLTVDFQNILAGNPLTTGSSSLFDYLAVANGLNLSGNSLIFTPITGGTTTPGGGAQALNGWTVAAATVPEPATFIPAAGTLLLLTFIRIRQKRITKY